MTETTPEVKGFYLFSSQLDSLALLPPEQAMRVLFMCRDFCAGKEPDMSDPVVVCVFGMMRPSLEKSSKLAENGRKGGEANRSKPKQTEANGSKPKQIEANKNKNKNKKQEQENINTNSCAELDKPARTQEAEGAAISLPLVSREMHYVQQADVDHWQELFPGVDVMQELRRMLAWLEANPRQRKTRNGIARFVTSWLDREQNRARTSRASTEPQRKTWAELEEERNMAEYLRLTGGAANG